MSYTNTYTVTGMTCGHCATSVREEISEIDGVTEVNVDVATGLVDVASEVELERAVIAEAVSEAGYQLVG